MKESLNFKTKDTNPVQDKIIESIKQKTSRFTTILKSLNKTKEEETNIVNIKMSAIKFLEKNFDKENNEIKEEVFKRAFLFMSRMSVTLDQDTSTELFTSMFAYKKANSYKLLSEDFSTFKTKVKDFSIFLSQNKDIIKSITGMQHGLGLPDLNKLKELLNFCKENSVDLKSITGMQHGLGLPDLKKLKSLVDWCITNNIDIIKVTRLQIGIPTLNELEQLKSKGGLE
jgi:hypothetical protein